MLLNGIYAQLFLIVAALLWFALSNRRTNAESFIKAGSIAVLLLGLWVGGVWLFPPSYGLILIALIFVGLLAFHFKKAISQATKIKTLASNTPLLFILPLSFFLISQGLNGRQTPVGNFIELSSPFETKDGACVLSGGTSRLLNFHIFPSDKPRDLAQQYALDIIKVGSTGFRTKEGFLLNPKPRNIQAYEIFDANVYAPCDGLVVEHQNNLPDQPIGGSDKVNTGGNGIVLQCGNHHVHLHHMKQGSVSVELNEEVKIGQKIGQIGNSGNTIEPHLHLHAETIVKKGDTSVHGSPVHMRFGQKFMARGDCF